MKKMRRLIPAIAMLLVSAVMLSTASFAWFTMNDEVTASGMQIQAKSTGSLVVSATPLQYNSVTTSVDLGTSTAQTIKPITWDADAWKLSNGTVDPITGKVEGDALEAIDATFVATEYFVDRQIYIGSAGDEMLNQQLNINLSAIAGADELASKAYSVAIYVINPGAANWDNGAYPATSVAPDAVLHVDSLKDADADFNRNVIVLKGTDGDDAGSDPDGYTIPSIVGVEQDNYTGLKVVLRFFVDGDLDALESDGVLAKKNSQTVSYEKVTTGAYDATKTYYTDAAGTAIANPQNLTDEQKADMSLLGDEETGEGYWYLRVVTDTPVEYKYVNSEVVPTTGTSLAVAISSAKIGG